MNRIDNIDFCIRYLMEQNRVEAQMPETLHDKQQLFRALMNIWEPQPLSAEFLQAQDAELQAQLQDKGVLDPERELSIRKHTPQSLRDSSPNLGEQLAAVGSQFSISLWQGDITRLKVDAIVNAANSRGLGCWHPLHACIDNAIHSAAGLQLRQECNNILRGGEIATGDSIITKGYNLPAKYVIHTVGPIIATGIPTPEQEQQLADCYRNCLRLAKENGCRSIAFCCISTGEFRFPNRRAAEIAVQTIKQSINSPSKLEGVPEGRGRVSLQSFRVLFNVFKDIDYDIYRQLLGKN